MPMIDKDALKQILEKEMTRKQFLQSIGVVFVGILGINSLLSTVTKSLLPGDATTKSTTAKKGNPFGRSKYGV